MENKIIYLQCAIHYIKKEKINLLECLKSIKVPSDYSSNIFRKVSMNDLKLIYMKSHDYHIMLTHLISIIIWEILPQNVRYSINKLCFFYNSICSKVLNPTIVSELQTYIVVTLYELEIYFSCRSRPEWSIVEGYITEEVIEFYIDSLEGVESIGLYKSQYEGRLQGVGTIRYKLVMIGLELRQKNIS
jgi:hypothetical protein